MTVHRLNRFEYQRSVRDLIGLEVDIEALLPPDDADAEGFDNNAEVLSVSTTLMERYLTAARRISQLALGDSTAASRTHTYSVPQLEAQDDRTSDDLPFGSRGGLAVRHYFPLDGEYEFKIDLRRNFYNYIRGLGNVPHQLDVRVDKALVETFMVGGDFEGSRCATSYCGSGSGGFPEWGAYSVNADEGLRLRVPVKAGMRMVGLAFVRRPALDEGVLQPPASPATFGFSTDGQQDGNPAVLRVVIRGPFDGRAPVDTPVRQNILVCRPNDRTDEAACAEQVITSLARRAYRRPVTTNDVESLLGIYREGRSERDFEFGIERMLEALLSMPQFLMRIERQPVDTRAGDIYRLSDLELATRLSFFLWRSIPDDELLELAERNELSDPETLTTQVRRMLADRRATRFMDDFVGQWLQVRNLFSQDPDGALFAGFNDSLRKAMVRETEMFFRSQVRQDRPIQDLLRADYTFLNEQLARHYGVEDLYGSHFRRYTWDDDRRHGLLGHASLLTVTSYANRTSVVLRGLWVLEALLGAPPPPPPPNVPPLPESDRRQPTSLRERMEQHRSSPVCASCHTRMDPLGFAMEHFDAIGRWRESDGGAEINATVTLNGATIDSPRAFREALLASGNEYARTVTEKLMIYALGRGVDFYDAPIIRRIVRGLEADDFRWSSLVLGVATSEPFLLRRAPVEDVLVAAQP